MFCGGNNHALHDVASRPSLPQDLHACVPRTADSPRDPSPCYRLVWLCCGTRLSTPPRRAPWMRCSARFTEHEGFRVKVEPLSPWIHASFYAACDGA